MSLYMHTFQSRVTSLQLSVYMQWQQNGMATHAGKHLAPAIRCFETDLCYHGDGDALARESGRENSLKSFMTGFAEI